MNKIIVKPNSYEDINNLLELDIDGIKTKLEYCNEFDNLIELYI